MDVTEVKRRLRLGPLAVILAAALAHGLLYVFLVPPWQHYDEPTHFEYAWLMANRPGWPQVGDFDQDMRRQVASSMLENGFFHDLSFRPDLTATKEPIWLGISQLHHAPLYYLVASLPLRLMRGADMALQLRAVRLVSLLMLLATIVAAWQIARLLLASTHPLRWLVPASVALLPGFVDLMTAANNDAGAVMAFSFFLWACLRLVLLPVGPGNLLLAGALAFVCYQTKSTVVAAVPLLGLAVALGLLRGRWRRLLWAGGLLAVLAAAAFGLMWGDAAFWYRDTVQTTPTRVQAPQSPVGEQALHLDIVPGSVAPKVFQLMPSADAVRLRGTTVTLGAWIWATEPARITTLRLYDPGRLDLSAQADVGTAPQFYTLVATLPGDASRPRIVLEPTRQPAKALTVYYDGLVLTEGRLPANAPPQFAASDASAGTWGGQPFVNVLRNGSAEAAWVSVHPRANGLMDRVFQLYVPPTLVLNAPLDWPATGRYFNATAANLVRTFWAKFGWGNVPLLGQRPYAFLAVLTALGLAAAAWSLLRARRRAPWDAMALLGFALAAVWGQAMVRGLYSLMTSVFVPGARYAYPVIVPTLLVLDVGWWQVLGAASRLVRWSQRLVCAAFVAAFLALDVYALISLVTFYAARSG